MHVVALTGDSERGFVCYLLGIQIVRNDGFVVLIIAATGNEHNEKTLSF